eukprot:7530896-Pyramimonas_sp.AAC.1
MVSAAKATRNHMIALADLQNVSQGAELNALVMRSAARTVWTNDGTTARMLIQSSPLARRHLRIQDGK